MEYRVLHSLMIKKNEDEQEFLEVAFTGKKDEEWEKLFEEDVQSFNEGNVGGYINPLGRWKIPIHYVSGKWFIQEDEANYQLGTRDREFFDRALEIIVNRTNIRRGYKS